MEESELCNCFSASLRRLRRRRHLTQVEMARLCGVSLGTIRSMERGRAPAELVLPAAVNLARCMGCGIGELIGEEEEPAGAVPQEAL